MNGHADAAGGDFGVFVDVVHLLEDDARGLVDKLHAGNRIEGDTSDHSATPTISNGQLFLRSAKTLYCIGE